jgi:mannose-6-phosphate isomerase-like protein (cupin superfamily)
MKKMRKIGALAFALSMVLSAAAQDTSKVVFVPAKKIESDIRKAPANSIGESELDLIERTPTHAGILLRRTAPGKAEVHETEADVWLVIDGGAVLVTGGSVIGGAQTEPGEIRGSAISKGEEHQIAKGDFIRIPTGVPHWLKKINGEELVYIVVKYAAPK